MIKRYMIFVMVLALSTSLYANDSKKSNKFKIDELVFLPSPGKFVKKGKIQLTNEQKKGLKNIKRTIVPNFQNKMREAHKIQRKVQKAVAKGKTKEEVRDLLDKIAQLKREAIDYKIDALNAIEKVLTKEQWQVVNKLTYK